MRLKWVAAATVALLHVGLYQMLSQSQGVSRASGPAAEAMRVEFIDRVQPTAPTPVRLRKTATRKPRPDAANVPTPSAPKANAVEDVPMQRNDEPLVLGWQEAEPADPEFRRNPTPTDTATGFPASPPDRMRMRRQITGKDIVEGTAQMLGMWPPGYESDPCPRVQRNIARLMTDASASGREQLGEEVRRRRVACSQ